MWICIKYKDTVILDGYISNILFGVFQELSCISNMSKMHQIAVVKSLKIFLISNGFKIKFLIHF